MQEQYDKKLIVLIIADSPVAGAVPAYLKAAIQKRDPLAQTQYTEHLEQAALPKLMLEVAAPKDMHGFLGCKHLKNFLSLCLTQMVE